MRRTLFATVAVALFSTSALAEGYRCEISDLSAGFISSWLGIKHEQGAATANVYDAVIRAVHGKPIEVVVKDRGKGRIRMTYTLADVPTAAESIRIIYTINLDTTDNTVTVRGNPVG